MVNRECDYEIRELQLVKSRKRVYTSRVLQGESVRGRPGESGSDGLAGMPGRKGARATNGVSGTPGSYFVLFSFNESNLSLYFNQQHIRSISNIYAHIMRLSDALEESLTEVSQGRPERRVPQETRVSMVYLEGTSPEPLVRIHRLLLSGLRNFC